MQRHLILLHAKDRIEREFAAMQEFRKDCDCMGDLKYKEDDLMQRCLRKHGLPNNLFLSYDEGISCKSTITLAVSTLKKILLRKSSVDEILSLSFTATEMDEFDLGWFVFAQPMGYCGRTEGPIWSAFNSPDEAVQSALHIICGIEDPSFSAAQTDAMFHALISAAQHAANSPASPSKTIDQINSGGSAMDAIKELLGEKLFLES